MEDLKEMFAQMMRFQIESQQKRTKKNNFNFNKKKAKKDFFSCYKEKEQENEEKQQRFFLELHKQEALFKSLSNNQPTDSTAVFTQNAVWNAIETFIYASDEDKTFEAYYRRYEDIYITDCADWTDAKKSSATTTKARNCGTQQVRRLYLTKKKQKNNKKLANILETVKLLSELFSSKTSLFHKRWKCLSLTKGDSDDYLGFASVVNKNCDDFKLGE